MKKITSSRLSGRGTICRRAEVAEEKKIFLETKALFYCVICVPCSNPHAEIEMKRIKFSILYQMFIDSSGRLLLLNE